MLRVLIAEDNLILADILEDTLVDGGYEICGIAGTVQEGIRLVELHKPDLAVLDYRLADGGFGTEIISGSSIKNNMGILYVSADSLQDLLNISHGDACLQKPYSINDLLIAMHIVSASRIKPGSRNYEEFYPKNFYLLEDHANPKRRLA